MTANILDRKIAAARKKLGERYLCHPANHIKRLDVPLADSVGTDIRRTFERAQAEADQRQRDADEAQTKVKVIGKVKR